MTREFSKCGQWEWDQRNTSRSPYVDAPYTCITEFRGRRVTFLGCGRMRDGYLIQPTEKWVIKIPRNTDGITANQREAKWSGKTVDGVPFARCKLIPGTDSWLLIEFLEDARFHYKCSARDRDTFPEWGHTLKDDAQYGINRKGRQVAFDFAEQFGRI